jgi:hypothetical protein
MRYSAQSVQNHGGRLILNEGSIDELYGCISRALEVHYQNNRLVLRQPAVPHFGDMRFGETRLRPFGVEDGISRIGSINVVYFRGGVLGKPRKEVDFKASRAFGFTDDKTTYDSLTVYFDISRKDIPQELLDWARDAERDVFLDKIVAGELS